MFKDFRYFLLGLFWAGLLVLGAITAVRFEVGPSSPTPPEEGQLFIKQPSVPYILKEKDGVHTLMLNKTVVGALAYFELYFDLAFLSKDDRIDVYISGDGGSAAGLRMLTYILTSTDAMVRAVVVGDTFSAHSMLICVASEVVIEPDIQVMYHSYYSGFPRKGSDAMAYILAVHEGFRDFFKTYCRHIISEEEVEQLLTGTDIYLSGDDIRKRIKTYEEKQA